MHFTTTTLALALAATVSAHTTMFSVWVNGADQGDGRNVYIRSPPSNSPVKDLASTDLVCNVNGAKAVSSFVKAAAGSTLTFEWFHDNRGDDIIDGSHKGPIITYIAPFTTGNGASSIWTKIAEEGFDSSSKLWAVDKLKTNGGKKDFTLPAGLAAGKYLIRQEIIALHESDAAFNVNSARGAQFYPSCVQIEVTGSGTVVPNQNFNFNTGYTYSDLGILFNLYGSFTSYTIPGPKVFTFAASAPVVATTTTLKAAIPVATTTTAAVVPTTTSKAAAVVPTTTSKAVIPPSPLDTRGCRTGSLSR
ncbi:glycosyl hydrolase family 61-domain-containing protein [Podospora appendiculata]|uniref:lytic cellulose monooxygenase (C4-dehydrogenating) n=1 Tax=Podospora appendiculata TaxID=314037 RepID=A0AAE0XDD1_9PEZI|nr:glycosyl hydrolase family 61-domain-containing protein [Podospora appendiculata]